MKTIAIKYIFPLLAVFILLSATACQRDGTADEDDIPQEEITNIILLVKDLSTGITSTYDYNIGAGGTPNLVLGNGQTYDVEVKFRNGNEDASKEIVDAKDEHFLIFDFPKSDIELTRIDGNDLRSDGMRVGMKTRWTVNNTSVFPSPILKLTLIHDAESVQESKSGTAWGSVLGGETDAEATYNLLP